MIFGYIRVSTGKQTLENQRFEINQFCKQGQMSVDAWYEETISGTMSYGERELGRLLQDVCKGDVIICTELSRLGRNLFMIMEILNACMTAGCQLWTVKDGYRLGEEIHSKVLAFAFGLTAELERTLNSQRTRESLALRRSEGKVLGRPTGSHNRVYMLDGRRREIRRWLSEGVSKSEIARRCGTCRKTVQKWMEREGEKI